MSADRRAGPPDVDVAAGYLESAREDRRKGFDLSACLTAQKAAELALQAYARSRGLDATVDTLPGLLACVPGGREPALERAAAELERFRMDPSSAYRSAGPLPDATPTAADACCAAAATILAHVRTLFGAAAGEGRP